MSLRRVAVVGCLGVAEGSLFFLWGIWEPRMGMGQRIGRAVVARAVHGGGVRPTGHVRALGRLWIADTAAGGSRVVLLLRGRGAVFGVGRARGRLVLGGSVLRVRGPRLTRAIWGREGVSRAAQERDAGLGLGGRRRVRGVMVPVGLVRVLRLVVLLVVEGCLRGHGVQMRGLLARARDGEL